MPDSAYKFRLFFYFNDAWYHAEVHMIGLLLAHLGLPAPWSKRVREVTQ